MFEAFDRVSQEKRERIINAALREFSKNGYKKASTDEIVKAASISKGALFHYFNSKKELFFYLYVYAVDLIKTEILTKFDMEERDIFARLRQTAYLKADILKKHPELYDFLTSAYFEQSPDVAKELSNQTDALMSFSKQLLGESIDTGAFKDEIDPKSAIEIIVWTVDGFSRKHFSGVGGVEQMEELMKKLDGYLDTLRSSFYKNTSSTGGSGHERD